MNDIQSQAIISISDLSIGYQNKKSTTIISEHIHLNLFKGEMVCLLGANGCGKSTLIRTLAGMQPPINGEILIDNEHISQLKSQILVQKMAVVLTENVTVQNMTVFELVSLGRYPYTNWFGTITSTDTKIILDALKKVGLEDFKDKYFQQLSDGEKQRVMIAKALAQDTPFILLDEPTAHLDLPSRIDVMKLLKELAHSTNKAIVISTHELELALQISDKIWLMQKGNEVQCGTPKDLVLDGSLKRVFNKQSFIFENSTNTFKIGY